MQYRKRSRRARVWVLVGALLFMICIFYGYLNAQIRPALKQMAQVRVNALVSDVMYSSVLDEIASGALDEPFLHVTGEGGQILSSQLNNSLLTRFAAQIAQVAQKKLIAYGEQGLDIPLGTLSGAPTLAGKGPMIHFSFFPETNTQAFFTSDFRSAGINQTQHRIMLRLEAQVAIVLPGETQILVSHVDVPVAEQIIVGGVPDTYADFNLGREQLNLVPRE